jgi:hypothetical protein
MDRKELRTDLLGGGDLAQAALCTFLVLHLNKIHPWPYHGVSVLGRYVPITLSLGSFLKQSRI